MQWLSYGIGILVVAVILIAGLIGAGALKGFGGSSKLALPPLPPFGALPTADLSKYFDTREPAIAWATVRAWDLNQMPPTLAAPGPVDQIVLTPRLLNFCSGATGKIELVFNFLVEAVLQVDFDPRAVPAGMAPPDHGLVTVHTPSGRTLLIASRDFAGALQQAVYRARSG